MGAGLTLWERFQTHIRDIFIIFGVSEDALTCDTARTCETVGTSRAWVCSVGAKGLQAGWFAQCGGIYFRTNRSCLSERNLFEL